ncbi:MAG: protease complex subunit PrcB family protein [Acidobacteria bacterium]|nr:protease complex subunit PrcB family protein [Acidobacteriota bacterium]
MKILKFFLTAILSFNFTINCAAQTSREKNAAKPNQTGNQTIIRERKPSEKAPDEASLIRTIAEGSHASVTTPFVFVARTPDAFARLQKLVEISPAKTPDFRREAIVAVFAGTKNTGGYTLGITGNARKISVRIVAPPKDAIVTQVITTPYKIVSIDIKHEDGLNLDLSPDFTNGAKNYRLTSGNFESSGGFAGAKKKLAAQGTIRILNWGEYLTLVFDLMGKAGENRRRLSEIVSGALSDGKINLPRVQAADFIDRPHPFMMATGNLSKNKLSLLFVPGEKDFAVSDGYAGVGNLQAIKN